MSKIEVPPIGTRVAVETRYSIEWMNQNLRPIVGTVAHSNSWDKPDTFRLINVEFGNSESVISMKWVQRITVVGEAGSGLSVDLKVQSFEIKGSKGDIYTVTLDGEKSSCNCQAGTHGRACKHVKTAREMLA